MKPYAKDNNKLWKFVSKQLRNKFKFIVFNEDTLDEEFSFRLSLLTIFFILGGLSILSVLFTSYIIAFTPLKQYIPGYTDAAYQKKFTSCSCVPILFLKLYTLTKNTIKI